MKFSDLSRVISFMMFASAVCSSSREFTITNGPQDTTVCMNDMAECTCGFDGADPLLTSPDWTIVTRSSSGSVISNVTIDGEDILINVHRGFKWILGPRNSTSAPGSKLIFGPVNKTHNQSSYQCVFNMLVNQFVNGSNQFHSVESSVGTLTVVDPSVGNITVNETCLTSLSISWNTYNDPACGDLSLLATISSIATDTKTFTVPSNGNYFMFTNLSSDTIYNVTVNLTYKKKFTTNTTMYNVKTSAPCILPPVIDIMATDTENDDIRITWEIPELNCCVPEIKYYNVTVMSNENSTSKNTTAKKAYLSDFLIYHANISFTVIVVAVNSQGSSEPTSETIGDTKEEEESSDGSNESNTAVIVVIVIILILFIIVIVVAAIILVYWKYHTKGGDCNKNASKLPMENSYVDSQNTNDNSDLAYAVTGPSSMFTEHRDVKNTTETTNSSIHSTKNNEDVPTAPPQLPPKLNYAELQMADQLPSTIQKDTRVTYAKTIPA